MSKTLSLVLRLYSHYQLFTKQVDVLNLVKIDLLHVGTKVKRAHLTFIESVYHNLE